MELDALINIISDITKIDSCEITKDTVLITDLALDSLELYKIVTEIESKLDIMVDIDSLSSVSTVEELYSYFTAR